MISRSVSTYLDTPCNEHIQLHKTDHYFTSDTTASSKAHNCPCGILSTVAAPLWLQDKPDRFRSIFFITPQLQAGSLLKDFWAPVTARTAQNISGKHHTISMLLHSTADRRTDGWTTQTHNASGHCYRRHRGIKGKKDSHRLALHSRT